MENKEARKQAISGLLLIVSILLGITGVVLVFTGHPVSGVILSVVGFIMTSAILGVLGRAKNEPVQ